MGHPVHEYFSIFLQPLVEIIKILVLSFFQQPLKQKVSSTNFSICAYRVFYIPILRRIEGGGEAGGVGIHPLLSLQYQKKSGPERVKSIDKYDIYYNKYIEC